MEVIGCLVPKLQSEMHSGCGMQLFEKTQRLYVAMVNLMSLYTIVLRKFTCILVKKQLGSQQRQLGKTAVIEAGSYIVSMDIKTTVYGLEAGKIVLLNCHSNVLPYFTSLPLSSRLYRLYNSRASFIITVQAPCDTLV